MEYTIKDAAALTGLSAYTIRYYEDAGILQIPRNRSGNRVFSDSDLEWLRYVNCLKITGMSIAQIVKLAELTRQGETTIAERRVILEAHRKELFHKMEAVREATECIEYKISCFIDLEAQVAKRQGVLNQS